MFIYIQELQHFIEVNYSYSSSYVYPSIWKCQSFFLMDTFALMLCIEWEIEKKIESCFQNRLGIIIFLWRESDFLSSTRMIVNKQNETKRKTESHRLEFYHINRMINHNCYVICSSVVFVRAILLLAVVKEKPSTWEWLTMSLVYQTCNKEMFVSNRTTFLCCWMQQHNVKCR